METSILRYPKEHYIIGKRHICSLTRDKTFISITKNKSKLIESLSFERKGKEECKM